MGWSIDIHKPDLDAIFTGLEKQYTIQNISGETPAIRILYEGEIPHGVMKHIVGLFPEFVYVNFVPNSTFPIGQSIAETH